MLCKKKFFYVAVFTCIIFLFYNNAYPQKKSYLWKFEETPEWFDEFDDSNMLDSTKWTYETGGDGWGNNELQYYTKGENISLADGLLKITARKEKKELHFFQNNHKA